LRRIIRTRSSRLNSPWSSEMKKLLQLCLFLGAILCHPLAVLAADTQYDAFYVFGDSLSDTGNDFLLTQAGPIAIPPSESPRRTYFRGRFSNGPVAFEYLWGLLQRSTNAPVVPVVAGPDPRKKGAISFAYGGAKTGMTSTLPIGLPIPGLLGQVNKFAELLGNKPPKREALYGIWAGANDYILATPAELADPQLVDHVVGNITTAINNLYTLGARDFIVLNLPDLGQIPLIVHNGPGATALFHDLSTRHNDSLKQSLNDLTHLPGIKIQQFDVPVQIQVILANSNTTLPALDYIPPHTVAPKSMCLLVDPFSCVDVNFNVPLVSRTPFFYWDVQHPTTFVHGVLGLNMFRALTR
jgi:phospholipase/lecithinase/hemolysin